jgi:hypothetical protein
LAKLANRVGAAMQGKILGEIHGHIPMVTPDEQRAVQLENAEADARFWADHRDFSEAQVEGHRALAATVETAIAGGQAVATDAGAKAATAKDRVERLKRGEDVPGGLGKPLTWKDAERICREAGLTRADMRDASRMHEVSTAFGFETVMEMIHADRDRAEKATVRRLARKLNGN